MRYFKILNIELNNHNQCELWPITIKIINLPIEKTNVISEYTQKEEKENTITDH